MLVTTTLLGPGTLNHARDALKTVRGDADRHLLICDPKDQAEARTLLLELPAGTGVLHLYPWQDFAHARNVALRGAFDVGGSWAITLDTDERLFLPPHTRETLSKSTDPVLLVPYQGDVYSKERIFRLPAKGQWTGPTHESFLPPSQPAMLQGAFFVEMPKTDDEYRAKCLRDVSLLAPYSRKHPKNPRWHFYLGESFKGLARWPEAFRSFAAAWELDGWEEESALAAYRAAECQGALGAFRVGQAWCSRSLLRAPWMPEPAWLAGVFALELDRPHDAIAWAHVALAHGYGEGRGAHTMTRIGFQHPPAQWEGPYEVLTEAYTRLGNARDATMYATRAASARAARTRANGAPLPTSGTTADGRARS